MTLIGHFIKWGRKSPTRWRWLLLFYFAKQHETQLSRGDGYICWKNLVGGWRGFFILVCHFSLFILQIQILFVQGAMKSAFLCPPTSLHTDDFDSKSVTASKNQQRQSFYTNWGNWKEQDHVCQFAKCSVSLKSLFKLLLLKIFRYSYISFNDTVWNSV